MIAAFAILDRNFEKARQYSEQLNPEFSADADPMVNTGNVAHLIGYAFILQNLGENERADTMLDIALEVVQTLPRIGFAGHGIRDVQILALQGKTREALTALRDAMMQDSGEPSPRMAGHWPSIPTLIRYATSPGSRRWSKNSTLRSR